ncbi:MAG: hypothetical protein ACREBF_01750, partial [Candidatus Micrarchaeales archaeon]
FKIENFNIPHAQFLIDKLTFEQKFRFLKKQNVFRKNEHEDIAKFQMERNGIFHSLEIDMLEGIVGSDKEWEKIHNISKKAFNSVYKAFNRENNREWVDWPKTESTDIEF